MSMYMSFFELVSVLKEYFLRERPASVLIISKSAAAYARFIADCMRPLKRAVKIDIVPIDDGRQESALAQLAEEKAAQRVDCILLTDVMEHMPPEACCSLLGKLLAITKKSILAVTPMLTERQGDEAASPYRAYSPTTFRHFDFSSIVVSTACGNIQCYSFFPQKAPAVRTSRSIEPVPKQQKKLRIGYVLPHKNLTGGMKCLLEQMRQLHRKGHTVYAVYQGQKGESAIPAWSDIDLGKELSGQIILSNEQDKKQLAELVDALLVGFYSQISEYSSLALPLVYWEQGYEALYGDYGALLHSGHEGLLFLRQAYQPVHYPAVADIVADVLEAKYGVKAKLLYNGIDTDFYKPSEKKQFGGTILLVGNPALAFKNFGFALSALNKAWEQGARFKVKWACQTQPNVVGVNFPIEFHVMPPQKELAELYRNADIFLFTSVYESFPMPPMEAMASGVPVIATDCGGILTYGIAGENLLLVDQEDTAACAAAILHLLEDEGARQMLSDNGLKTAQSFHFDRIVEKLESYFHSITTKEQEDSQ